MPTVEELEVMVKDLQGTVEKLSNEKADPVKPRVKNADFSVMVQKSIELKEKRQVRMIISTAGEDRDGDIVVLEGIDLTNYGNNPVVLFQHNSSLPIARTIEISVSNGKMVALAQFPKEGLVPKSDEVFNLVYADILNAASIGFMPDWQVATPRDKEHPWDGYIFPKSELLEWSFVSIPANPGATRLRGFQADIVVDTFYSWTSKSGTTQGKVTEVTETLVRVKLYNKGDDGAWNAAAEPISLDLALCQNSFYPIEPLDKNLQEEAETDCTDTVDQVTAKEARLRQVEALSLAFPELTGTGEG